MWTYEPRRPAPITTVLAVAATIMGIMMFGAEHRGVAESVGIRVRADTGFELKVDYSDANILGVLDQVNKTDSLAGEYAAARATDPKVRAYAQRMMTEHHRLRDGVRDAALALKIHSKIPSKDPLQPAVDSEMARLRNAAPGPIFDKAYIDQEIQIHKTMIDLAKGMRAQTKQQPIKDLIDRAMPSLTDHLNQALAIQPKIESKT